jgi:transcription initiation factor TFIID TATA-box-binding protein
VYREQSLIIRSYTKLGQGVPISKYKIQNIVASAFLGKKLDLQELAISLSRSDYEPERFPGLVYRLKDPKTATLLFRSGKMVCTGASSLEQLKLAIGRVTDDLRNVGVVLDKEPEIEVHNMVSTSDLGQKINLNITAITLGLDKVEYEPEQFPGLVFRMDEPKVVLLLFSSGKIVCTGAKRMEDVESAIDKITENLMVAGLLS